MRILVTNDDGIHAPGLALLEEAARALSDDVWVVAPAEEMSGAGHSLTLTYPIRVRQDGEQRYAVRGTPTDCVMMALGHIMRDARPDILLSGINSGANLAEDVTYSGTVSAAMEGTLYGVRAIALSQANANPQSHETDFDAARQWVLPLLRTLIDGPWTPGVLLNVNFPPIPAHEVTGVRATTQGFRDIGQTKIVERLDVRGQPYYWFGLGRAAQLPGHDTDLQVLRSGAISVTPLHLDLTHRAMVSKIGAAVAGLTPECVQQKT